QTRKLSPRAKAGFQRVASVKQFLAPGPNAARRPHEFRRTESQSSISQESHMQRTASAIWNGTLKDGHGSISTASGVLANAPYSFLTRFENGKGTNPEELIGAAHAGCFAMALSAQLSTMNFTPD